MYMSPEEFEGYLAKQQALQPASPEPRKRVAKRREEVALSYILCATTLLALVATIPFMLSDANMKQSDRTATWDKILGIGASVSGYEYNADADTLTERLTFRKKR